MISFLKFSKIVFCFVFVVNFFFLFSENSFASISKHVEESKRILVDVEQLIKDKNKNPSEKRRMLINKYTKNIDFKWNAKMALGRFFLQLSEEDKLKYIEEYKKFITHTWLSKLNPEEIKDVKMSILEKSQKINDFEEYVTIVFQVKDDVNYEAVLRTRIQNDTFQILNVCVEGIDFVNYYRSVFLDYIEQHNNNAKSIVKYLEDQNKKIANSKK